MIMEANWDQKSTGEMSEDLRRLISAYVVKEFEKLHVRQEKDENSRLRKFAEGVTVSGLTDSIKARHKFVKFLWLVIFLGGMAAALFFVYKILEEYQNEPTATKVNIQHQERYSFPPADLCVDTWLDTNKATAMGLSEEGIKFALRYLIPFEDVMTEEIEPSKNVSGIKEEFFKTYHQHNFTSLVEFFKFIAADAVMNSKNDSEIGFRCNGCEPEDYMEKVIIHKSVCYRIKVRSVEGIFRQSYGLPEFEIRVPDLSRGLQKRRAYWKLYVNPSVTSKLMSDVPYLSIYHENSHSIRIMTNTFRMFGRDNQPCVETVNNSYSSLTCALDCAAKFYHRVHGCRVLTLEKNHSRPIDDFCNTYHWDRWPVQAGVNRTRAHFGMIKCVSQCRAECNFQWYFTSIDFHLSNTLFMDAPQLEVSRDMKQTRSAKLYFINLDIQSGGVLTFTEVSTYTLQTLVGNIGGTCGIWIGVSVMTLIQLCMFCVEQSVESIGGSRTKQKSSVPKAKGKSERITLV